MNFEKGKKYLYNGKEAELVSIAEKATYKFLVVHGHLKDLATWVRESELTELPPYHDFKRGEPVIAKNTSGYLYRRYFSHVGSNGKPYCFGEGDTAWSSEGITSVWDSARKLTEEEKAEARKDHEALLQYFSSCQEVVGSLIMERL